MDDKPFESLNVIPFVDIMLVLLTMVLTTATFVAVGRIPITLPQASPTKVEKQEVTTIEIAAGGIIHYEGSALGKKELEQRLKDLPKETNFVIRADKTIPFQAFIDVADVLKRGGFAKVGVETQSVGSAGSPAIHEQPGAIGEPKSLTP